MFGGIGVSRNQKASTTLEILDLERNNVGDVGAHAIAEALKAGVFDVLSRLIKGHVLVDTICAHSQLTVKCSSR